LIYLNWCGTNCIASSPPTQTLLSISDNINNPETCFVASPHSPFTGVSLGSDYETLYALYCPSIPNGVTTFTANFSASTSFPAINVIEVQQGQIATSNFWENVDNVATASVSGTTATVSTTGPTTIAGDFVPAMLFNSGGTENANVGANYAGMTVNPTTDPGYISEATDGTTATTYTATINWPTTNRGWMAIITPLIHF
jgi:hypothetical protein